MVHSFVPERLALLKDWAEAGPYRQILTRKAGASARKLIEVVDIRAFELAAEGRTIDPYMIVHDGDRQVFRTATAAGVKEAR